MKCEEVRQALPLFIYGELGFDDEDAVGHVGAGATMPGKVSAT